MIEHLRNASPYLLLMVTWAVGIICSLFTSEENEVPHFISSKSRTQIPACLMAKPSLFPCYSAWLGWILRTLKRAQTVSSFPWEPCCDAEQKGWLSEHPRSTRAAAQSHLSERPRQALVLCEDWHLHKTHPVYALPRLLHFIHFIAQSLK